MDTSTTQSAGAVIKSDRTGRTRYTAEYKRQVLDAFATSCLSAPAFAQQCGVKYPTFAAWIAGRKRGVPAEPGAPHPRRPAFLLAESDNGSGSDALEVRLPGGAVARATDAAHIRLLAELLRRLA